jgi:hypothetical protein
MEGKSELPIITRVVERAEKVLNTLQCSPVLSGQGIVFGRIRDAGRRVTGRKAIGQGFVQHLLAQLALGVHVPALRIAVPLA